MLLNKVTPPDARSTAALDGEAILTHEASVWANVRSGPSTDSNARKDEVRFTQKQTLGRAG